jgi:hypothetical protein
MYSTLTHEPVLRQRPETDSLPVEPASNRFAVSDQFAFGVLLADCGSDSISLSPVDSISLLYCSKSATSFSNLEDIGSPSPPKELHR